ncbi:MAG: trypsin-like peptidase domain-containing protein [Bdellovibrionaceae bacterium]|nr:trypsin-like peptidase domain-containing protein [Bdellovibrio sp.]
MIGFIFVTQNTTAQSKAPAISATPPPQMVQKAVGLKLGDPLPGNLFIELAKAINPAVVNISTSVVSRGYQQRDPMLEMLEKFYGMPMQQPRGRNGKPQRQGLGTGFIIREDGLIITNNHVIQDADLVEVQLTESGKSYTAEVIGSDPRTDIALIKIKADQKLPTASLGSSKDLEVGEWVAAFGNPYGHGHSMTKGIISSKGREIEEINRFPLLQTDASINPGNSGGPLVNTKGQVIGVNSAIDARAQGIGFAIPIDEVKAILPQLEQRGSLRRGYLGISPGDIDEQAAAYFGLKDEEHRGAVILGIGDGPAKKAGLRIYDIITEINSKRIRNSYDLVNFVGDFEPGTTVKVKILRDEKNRPVERTISVKIGEKPEAPSRRQVVKNYQGQKAPFNLGFKISDLNATLRQEWRVEDDANKPIITEIDRNSIASREGFRVGDLIIDVNGADIKTANDVIKALKKGKNSVKLARPNGIAILSFGI